MNKIVKMILNILTVVAVLACLVCAVDLKESFEYAANEEEKEADTKDDVFVFEYEVKHQAYGEILDSYYVSRLSNVDVPEGLEDIYHVSEYAHASFMSKVYEEKGDKLKADKCYETMKNLKDELGDYKFTADEIDAVINKSARRQ